MREGKKENRKCAGNRTYSQDKKQQKNGESPMCLLRENEIPVCFGKLSLPSQGEGFGELALTGLTHALPWMAKKQWKWEDMEQVN